LRILFLTQVLPYPLDAGPKIRAYYVLRQLADAGHQVTLASFTREDDLPEHVAHLRRYCAEVVTVPMHRSRGRDLAQGLASLLSRTPFLVSRDRVPAMARTVKNLVRRAPGFDAVHADQLWMAPYALLARQHSPAAHCPLTVLDQHNAVFKIPERLAEGEQSGIKRAFLNFEAKKLVRCEAEYCELFDKVVWVTEEDRRALRDACPEDDPAGFGDSQTVIPIALDPSTRSRLPRQRDPHRITFMGGLHWPPNADGVRWFRDEIWPAVKERVPRAVLTVIGKEPRHASGNGSDPAVETTGYVPDPTPYLAETAVFIVPLLSGGGMRVKILDAWSWELPVVSTTIGAEGLHAAEGENLRLADDPAAFASAVIDVMESPELSARLARGGRNTLETRYDWRRTYSAWNTIYPPCAYST
jgi:polysaccharide biosynthesis protein PslH